jgi:hypothetical protein
MQRHPPHKIRMFSHTKWDLLVRYGWARLKRKNTRGPATVREVGEGPRARGEGGGPK